MTEDTSMHLCCSLDILMGSAAIHWLFRSAAPVTHDIVDNYPLREVDNARGCVHIVGP